ncbi:MAG TPA: glycosyltransferase family 39 protein [Acidimicrobiia bacterium]
MRRSADRRWWLLLGAVALVGLTVRVAFVLRYENPSPLAGDATFYHLMANVLADGHGFVDPVHHAADATHPPAYPLLLAVASRLGFRSVLDHQLWSCLIGSAVVIVVGVTGRELVDDATGIAAAVLAAVTPAFWINDGLLMSETVVQLVLALVVLFVYRTIRRPSVGNALVVGALCGVAALSRGELIALLVFMLVPLAWSLFRRLGARALRFGAAMLVAFALVLAPWIVYNLGRFERPVIVSTQGGATVAGANCPYTYEDARFIGLWAYPCTLFNRPSPHDARGKDQSVLDGLYLQNALDYVKGHETRAPVIAVARVGRVLGVYRPLQQLDTESHGADGRPFGPGVAALLVYYATVVAAAAGLVLFRRRGIPCWPVLTFAALVVLTAVTTYGATRFRVGIEIAMLVPAAAAVVHLGPTVDAIRRRGRHRSTRHAESRPYARR